MSPWVRWLTQSRPELRALVRPSWWGTWENDSADNCGIDGCENWVRLHRVSDYVIYTICRPALSAPSLLHQQARQPQDREARHAHRGPSSSSATMATTLSSIREREGLSLPVLQTADRPPLGPTLAYVRATYQKNEFMRSGDTAFMEPYQRLSMQERKAMS